MKKALMTIAVLLVFCSIPVLQFAGDATSDGSALRTMTVVSRTIQTESLSFDISIVGYEEPVDDIYGLIVQDFISDECVDEPKRTLFIFTEGYNGYTDLESTISDGVQNGDLISFAFTDVDWDLLAAYPNSHPEKPDVFALSVDNSSSSSFSRIGFERAQSISDLLSWATMIS